MGMHIVITTDGAAFEDAGVENELARILRTIADKVERELSEEFVLHDANGNRVGIARYSED